MFPRPTGIQGCSCHVASCMLLTPALVTGKQFSLLCWCAHVPVFRSLPRPIFCCKPNADIVADATSKAHRAESISWVGWLNSCFTSRQSTCSPAAYISGHAFEQEQDADWFLGSQVKVGLFQSGNRPFSRVSGFDARPRRGFDAPACLQRGRLRGDDQFLLECFPKCSKLIDGRSIHYCMFQVLVEVENDSIDQTFQLFNAQKHVRQSVGCNTCPELTDVQGRLWTGDFSGSNHFSAPKPPIVHCSRFSTWLDCLYKPSSTGETGAQPQVEMSGQVLLCPDLQLAEELDASRRTLVLRGSPKENTRTKSRQSLHNTRIWVVFKGQMETHPIFLDS